MEKDNLQSKTKSTEIRYAIIGILILYLVILLKLVLFKNVNLEQFLSGNIASYHSYNLVPFRTINDFWSIRGISFGSAFYNIIGNICIFMPLGYLLPTLFTKLQRFWKIFMISMGLSIVFEISQYVFRLGSLDVDDVILNTLGGITGYLIFVAFKHVFKNMISLYRFTLIVASITACFSFTILVAQSTIT